jgi:hypothetical protein
VTVFLHEVHQVVGTAEDEFEAAFRDTGGWMDHLGSGDDARLLWYAHQAHGSGPSYRVVTVTAIADGGAWERMARDPDLRQWAAGADRLRHDVVSSLLLALPWSPLVELDLGAVPATPQDHEPTLYMEDTMWPERGMLAPYLEAAGSHYVGLIGRPGSLLDLRLALVAAVGARPEVVLMQAVRNPANIVRLLATELTPSMRPPGSWMHDALAYRDQWRSRLLRTARWSPWP